MTAGSAFDFGGGRFVLTPWSTSLAPQNFTVIKRIYPAKALKKIALTVKRVWKYYISRVSKMLYNLFNIQIKTIYIFLRGQFWEKVCEDCINIQLLPVLSVTRQPTKTTFFCCTHRAEPNKHIFKDSSHFKGGSGISLRILDKLPGICQSCQQFLRPFFFHTTRLFSKNSWAICIGHRVSTLESSTCGSNVDGGSSRTNAHSERLKLVYFFNLFL